MLSMATLLTAHSRYLRVSSWLDAHYAQKERGPRKSTRQTFVFVYPLLEAAPHVLKGALYIYTFTYVFMLPEHALPSYCRQTQSPVSLLMFCTY
jgi:hypothetical protein